MDDQKLRNIRIVGWICMGLSIPILLTSIWLSETSAGTALLGSGIALLVIGIIMFGWAMKGAEAQ